MTALARAGSSLPADVTQLPALAPSQQTTRQATAWRGIQPRDMDSALRMAKAIAASGMAPKSYFQGNADPVAAIFTAMQLGAEVGLSPMSAVQNIAVINGRPGLFGPAMLAVVEASGLLEEIEEYIEGEEFGDAMRAVCIVRRKGRKQRMFGFSVNSAKRANLWGKKGPWTDYPDRMLIARARSNALRDVFPDVLLGLAYAAEELQDIPPDESKTIDLPRLNEPALEPKVAQIEVILPGDMDPAYFPQTKRGLDELVKFVADCVLDGGAGVVLLNVELLDRLAKAGYADEVADLREEAARRLRGEPDEPDAADDADENDGEG